MNKTPFYNNVIIITGASSGIGEELATQLARQGAKLVLAARNREKLDCVASKCLIAGADVIAIPTDVSEPEQCHNLINETIATYGRIDTLINNAGIVVASKFSDMSDLAVFEKVFRINFFGGVYCTHYALPHILKTKGRIVTVSSLRGKLPSGTADGYGASKHAMAEFYASLRNELSETGVSVTNIFPNWVKTGITSRGLKADGSVKGAVSIHENSGMDAGLCAEKIIAAAARRKRDVVLTLQGKAGIWLRMIAPSVVDKIMIGKTEQ